MELYDYFNLGSRQAILTIASGQMCFALGLLRDLNIRACDQRLPFLAELQCVLALLFNSSHRVPSYGKPLRNWFSGRHTLRLDDIDNPLHQFPRITRLVAIRGRHEARNCFINLFVLRNAQGCRFDICRRHNLGLVVSWLKYDALNTKRANLLLETFDHS